MWYKTYNKYVIYDIYQKLLTNGFDKKTMFTPRSKTKLAKNIEKDFLSEEGKWNTLHLMKC